MQIVDSNPNRVRGAYSDVSLVQKFEITDEEYSKRSGLFQFSLKM